MLIFGYHVAKTGGTTVMHHIIDHLGEDAYFGYGNHTSVERFFNQQPFWEELSPEQREPVRFVYGHHVKERALACAGTNDVALFSVIREPFSHFVSQFKYRSSMLLNEGRRLTAREFLEKRPKNAVSSQFFKAFPGLKADRDQPFGEEAVFEIMRQFRFLCLTEKLTDQSKEIGDALGIPPISGRYRVSQNTVDLEGIKPEDVYERSPVDFRLYEEVAKRAAGEKSALDYDDALFRERLKGIKKSISRKEAIEDAYNNFALFLRSNGKTASAKLHIALSGKTAPKFDPILNTQDRAHDHDTAFAVARTEFEMGNVYMRHHRPKLARACFEKAISLWPDHLQARIGLGNCLIRLQEYEKAKDVVEYIIEKIDPKNEQALHLMDQFSKGSDKQTAAGA
ncbi:MAG: tetratricopeptide repeat protein [Kordiimonadaceae bacterium]|nr:tetratricopeptide repeat protein [Kordiimonadaceae bacterium]MBO6569524.1 tetratricopeptide repeat protein [Kordiimonadaceae bacterium]MBO6964999.1 tetratricopeptide repeat protein [Kordiimonadaceae bacterium]